MATAVLYTLLTLTEAPSGEIEVQDAGTTTPRAIFTDTGLTTPATNPIQLDSAGRSEQGLIYTAPTAYKVIIRDSNGVTLYVRDNIDPGVPIGTGALAIANGGTGATTAEAALSNLGAATAAELADLAADVAAVVGALGSSEKTHIATGTTSQRPSVPEDGDIRRNTTTSKYEGFDGTNWQNFYTTGDTASQADMETGTSTTTVVTPGRVKSHPCVPKVWGLVTVSGSTATLTVGHGISSVSRTGTGEYTVNLSTAFSSSDYAVIPAVKVGSGTNSVWSIECSSQTTNSFQIKSYRTSSSNNTQLQANDYSFSVAAWGDQ